MGKSDNRSRDIVFSTNLKFDPHPISCMSMTEST
jgi:hypothetical protein